MKQSTALQFPITVWFIITLYMEVIECCVVGINLRSEEPAAYYFRTVKLYTVEHSKCWLFLPDYRVANTEDIFTVPVLILSRSSLNVSASLDGEY